MKVSTAYFQYTSKTVKLVCNESNLYKILEYWFRDILNFECSEKGLRLVSPPHFVYDFSRKIFLMFYVTNWPNFIVWLTILFKIIRNMCIVIVCEPGCDVINLKLTSSFQLICFPLWPKSQNKNLNILRMKELFKWNKKYFPSF